jgi:ATP-dependent RNA helicase DeaD
MQDPVEISVGKKNQGAEKVDHHYYMVQAHDRYRALKRIVDVTPDVYGIIFCRTRQETKDIADKLMADGYSADALHGDLSQAQRDLVMHRFRKKHLQLLVATDVAARGIDVNDLTHVINYNLPDDIEVYIHRSGRTGRAGKEGVSVSIIHSREMHRIKAIEKIAKKTFERKMVPQANEICEKQLFHFLDRVGQTELEESSPVNDVLPAVYEKLAEMDKEQLIKQFVAAEFNRFMEYYKDAPDLNIYKEERGKGGRREGRGGRDRGNASFSRLFLNIGKTDKLTSGEVIGLINSNMRGVTVKIGKIELLRNFSFVEVDKEYEQELITKLNKAKLKGKKVSLEVASPKPARRKNKRR